MATSDINSVDYKITDLNNFKFFSDSGIEIYMEKSYVITWKLSLVDSVYCTNTPEGYIMADVKYVEDYQTYVIDPDHIEIGFSTPAEIYLPNSIDRTNQSEVNTFIRDVLCGNKITSSNKKYKSSNIVKPVIELTLNVNNSAYTSTINVENFFGHTFSYSTKKISYGENDTDNEDDDNFVHLAIVDSCNVARVENNIKWEYEDSSNTGSVPYLYKIFNGTIPDSDGYYQHSLLNKTTLPEYEGSNKFIVNGCDLSVIKSEDLEFLSDDELKYIKTLSSGIAQYFPFVRYSGSLMQEKVSTSFIAANTLIIIEEVNKTQADTDGNVEIIKSYEKPYINDSLTWSLTFKCEEDSELKLITTDDDACSIVQITEQSFNLYQDEENKTDDKVEPITLTIGVCSDLEGCYLNYLGLYLKDFRDSVSQLFFLGVISIKTEIEGEDERYRALLGNFGIPDPKTYPNLFAEEEYGECLCNWNIVNKKCKELMLTYDKIFPYAGTYKALINALNFLGYDDIIIKEWYKLFDSNYQEKDVAFDSVDIQNGKLKSLLADYNIDYNDNKYTKLNWLSMVYHLNETSSEDYLNYGTDAWYVEKADGQSDKVTQNTLYFDVPYADPLYTYRDVEIIAKLLSLKKWLETYIVGLNAHIVDITGEGVIYAPQKTLIYQTGGYLADFESESPLTPTIVSVNQMDNSKASIGLTLHEFDNVTFDEYHNITFDMFNRKSMSIDLHSEDNDLPIIGTITYNDNVYEITPDINVYNISNTIGACIWSDEVDYILSVTPESGSLYYYTEDNSENQIIVADNTIRLMNSNTLSVKIKTDCLPTIVIKSGNIRKLNGSWLNNIIWSVKYNIDDEENPEYTLKACGITKDETSTIVDNGYIVLIPTSNSTLEYSSDNKWQTPMFIMSGYKFDWRNINISKFSEELLNTFYNMGNNSFILEINEGSMLFNNSNKLSETKVSTQVDFEYVFNTQYYESHVTISYKYTGNKEYITSISKSLYGDDINESISDNDYKSFIKLFQKDNNYTITYDDIKDYVKTNNAYVKNIANNLDNFICYKDSDNNIDNLEYFIKDYIDKKTKEIQNNFFIGLSNLIYDNIITNKVIEIPVNHIGDYSILVNGYDRFNNIYNNQRFKYVSIQATNPKMTLISTLEHSNNKTDFTTRNCYGSELTSDEIKEYYDLLNEDYQPNYPQHFMSYGMIYDNEDSYKLSWWNYSYNIETPQLRDKLVITNNNLLINELKWDVDNNILKCHLFDYTSENKHLVDSKFNNKFILIGYDLTCLEHVILCDNLTLLSVNETSKYAKYDADITLSFESLPDNFNDLINAFHANHTKFYLINVTDHIIDVNNISYNYDTNVSKIAFPEYTRKIFTFNDVIRVNYYVSQYEYRNITLDIASNNRPLQNGIVDILRPCFIVLYENESKYYTYYNGNLYTDPDTNNSNNIVDTSDDTKFFKKIKERVDTQKVYFVKYSYNKDSKNRYYTLYDLTKYDINMDLLSDLYNGNDYNILKTTDISFEYNNGDYKLNAVITDSSNVSDRLYNAVSYRITDIHKVNNYYTYTLDGLLDESFINRYIDDSTNDITVTVCYPYKDLVMYQTTVTENADLERLSYGNEYSMMLTSVQYDSDTMLLDHYIDNNFNNFVFDYNPDNLKDMWYTYDNNFDLTDYKLYKYYDMPLTISSDNYIIVEPLLSNLLDTECLSYEWSVYGYSYDFLTGINSYDTDNHLEKLFRINNKIFAMKPNKPGPNNIKLKVTDKYGNLILYTSSGILLVK